MGISVRNVIKASSLEFSIKECVAWAGNLTSSQDWCEFSQNSAVLAESDELPALKHIPAMQRRRLSPFAKLSLHCAQEAAGEFASTVPSVFASRHGDLQRTSKLISNVAASEELSPTQFGLSVHNAVGGLFSIYTGNKAPLTAISAGEDTFFTAIIDSVSKLYSNNYPRILMVYTETVVPEIYQKYVEQQEVSVSCALLIEKFQDNQDGFCLKFEANTDQKAHENRCLQVLDFLQFYYNDEQQVEVTSKRHCWTLGKL